LPAITRTSSGLANPFTLTPSATNQATQSWSLTTDTDSDQERRLRALYRYATEAIDWKILCQEYSLISINANPAASRTPKTQPLLDALGGVDSPVGLRYIGRYRDYVLYTRDTEQFYQFVLFILEATNLGSTTGQSGKAGGPARIPNISPAAPMFVLPPG
jgi:hypothetical protein